MFYVCKVIGFVDWLDRGLIYSEKNSEMCICLWLEFDCPEVTLCDWQDIKIQLLLLVSLICKQEWGEWYCGQMFLKVGEIQIYKHQKYCHRKDEVFCLVSWACSILFKSWQTRSQVAWIEVAKHEVGCFRGDHLQGMDCVGDIRSCMYSTGRRWHIHNNQK